MSEKRVVEEEEVVKHHFELVHGASHGAWCWYKIRSLMESKGHKVTCLDLKGSGINPADPDTIFTLEDYDEPLIKFMSNLPENEKVILVGHSSGGISLTDTFYRFGKMGSIKMIIYVAATMSKHGFSMDEDGTPDFSEYGDVIQYRYGLGDDQPPTSVIVKDEFQRQIFYHMSPVEDSILASMLLRPAPTRPYSGEIDGGDDDDSDSIPRVYIKTMHDRVLKPEQQDDMIKQWPPSQVFVLESDHSPFFSAPLDLFTSLVNAAESIKY
ncbi:hypothetical protein FNV43_RR05239 [Rhamnella rubrinervis]|uniref:AB hydrolase-1 domain-containing protein n=1 Tax=Rhamnella rubrinervis TaxID=2594499 RepID=A0A8K0MQA3_9ROSA|nr:hypothetical protein FNV43_RR05239 [Rhamnella rubrinervis]